MLYAYDVNSSLEQVTIDMIRESYTWESVSLSSGSQEKVVWVELISLPITYAGNVDDLLLCE